MDAEKKSLGAPKYLYSKSGDGVISAGEFIIRTRVPRCIAVVKMTDSKISVTIVQQWNPMPPEQVSKIEKEMTNWFYFSKHKRPR